MFMCTHDRVYFTSDYIYIIIVHPVTVCTQIHICCDIVIRIVIVLPTLNQNLLMCFSTCHVKSTWIDTSLPSNI